MRPSAIALTTLAFFILPPCLPAYLPTFSVHAAGAPTTDLPRLASLKKGEVNVRSGPGNQYPILWVYQRPGYPVRLLARYDNYWKIQDVEGEEGWVFIGMVSARRTALVQGTEQKPQKGAETPIPLYRQPSINSPVTARLMPGLVFYLQGECQNNWCEGEVEGTQGYLPQSALSMLQ